MNGWLAVVLLLGGSSSVPTSGDAALCRDRELAQRFLEYASPSFDYSVTGLEDAFRPYMPGLETCLKRWIEDGGQRDLPLEGKSDSRKTYQVYALALLGKLYPNAKTASWVRSSMLTWPNSLQSQAVSTLGEIGDEESFPFLKAEARRSDEQKQEQIWRSLVLLDGQRFAAELESIAQTHDEQVLVGSMLVGLGSPAAVPALRKLKMLVPEKAAVYERCIREFEKSGREDDGHEN